MDELGPGVERDDPGSPPDDMEALLVLAAAAPFGCVGVAIGLISLLLMKAFGCTSLDGFGFGVMVIDFDDSFCVLLRNSFCMFLTVLVCMGPNGLPMEFLRREFLRLDGSDVVAVFFLVSVVVLGLVLTSLVVFWPDGVVGEDGVDGFLLVVLCDDD